MEKFKAHMGKFGVLYILLALAIGTFVGSQWNKWFPKAYIAGRGMAPAPPAGYKNCGGNPECHAPNIGLNPCGRFCQQYGKF